MTRNELEPPDSGHHAAQSHADEAIKQPAERAAGRGYVDVAASSFDMQTVHDIDRSMFTARIDGEEAATLPYRQVAGRIVLLKTTVDLKFRGNGVATEFIGSVLNELRQQNAKIAVYCPLVRAFIDSHPQYANMVDQKRPGPNFGITAEAANTDRSPAGENFDDESER